MAARKNRRLRLWAWLIALVLALSAGLSAGGALAGKLTDTTFSLSPKLAAPTAPSSSTSVKEASATGSGPLNPSLTNLVISQVYGAGGMGSGGSAATYTNDFIEIFNPS